MRCNCNKSYYNDNRNLNCKNYNEYCNLCDPIENSSVEYFSYKYHNLENNYPVRKCLCSPFGTNPRYYSQINVPCNCKDKCYSC